MKMRFHLFGIMFFVSGLILAQEPVKQDELKPKANLNHPQGAVKTLLDNLQDENYHPDVAARALYGKGMGSKQLESLAIKLKQIYDGSGDYIYTNKITVDPNHMDSVSRSNTFVVDERFKGLYLKKYDNQWLFSKESVAIIEKTHKQVYKFGTYHLLNWLTELGSSYQFLGLPLWKLIGLFIIIAFALILHKILTLIFTRVIIALLQKWARARLAGKYIKPVAKPLSLLIVFYFISLLVPVLLLPPKAGHYVILALKALIPFFVMLVFYKLVDVLIAYLEKLAERTASTLDDQLVPLLRKAMKVFVVVIGTLFILDNFNVNITTLIAGLGITGLALALAAQDMLKNFFGSIMIFLDRPFQVGDWVNGDGIDGDVEEVGFRATRIRTFHNSVTYVPNGVLADMKIDNMGMRNFRRYKTYIAITYDTPPDLINAFVNGLRKIVENHPDTNKEKYHVYVNTFNNSSIDILFYIFFNVPNWGEELRARHEINLLIAKLAEKLGVRFAFPTQTIHIEDAPGQESKTPVYSGKVSEYDADVDDYISSNFKS